MKLLCPQVDDAEGAALPSCPEAGQISSVDLHLEHNTLVIMWPPCQEEWRHEVGLFITHAFRFVRASTRDRASQQHAKHEFTPQLPELHLRLHLSRCIYMGSCEC